MSVYRISEAAGKVGFSPSALRFYESSGLLPQAVRTSGGYRTYDDAAVERLRFVHRARGLGLPLEEIRELVQIWDAGACAPLQQDLAANIAGRRARVQDRIVELQALAAQLRDAELSVLAAPGDGGCGSGCACLAGPEVTSAGPDNEVPPRPVAAAELGLPPVRLSEVSVAPVRGEPRLVCALNVGQAPERLRAWQGLVVEALTREPLGTGERLVFSATEGLAARIAGLCELEQVCCSFFNFSLQLSQGHIVLEVTAPDGAGQLVTALLDGST